MFLPWLYYPISLSIFDVAPDVHKCVCNGSFGDNGDTCKTQPL